MAHKIRFADLRTVHYESDGSGRDTYITSPNGGFFKNIQQIDKKLIYPKTISNQIQYKAKSQAKPIHYISDGSGRDYYVSSDEGGISRTPGISKQFNFDNVLRSYQKKDSWIIEKPDWFQLGQSGKLDNKCQSQIQKDQNQKLLSQKLSKPKIKK